MYVMTGNIIFPKWKNSNGEALSIRQFTSVEIETSFKEKTQTAEIVLPRNTKLFDKYKVRELFRYKDPVIIQLGYDGNNVQEFVGYIQRVSSDIPITIRCEDEMMIAGKMPVNYVSKKVKLETLLKSIAPGYEVEALEVTIGDVRFSKITLAEALEKLKSDWNLYSYFDGKKLVCGKYYARDEKQEVPYFNLERNCVSNSLNYKNKEDIILKIDAKSILANGSKIEFSMGDEGGDHYSLAYYNITVKAELEKKVKADYERAKSGGFDGTFTAFGLPRVVFGQKVMIDSVIYPDRKGEYFIEAVNKNFGDGGYRQEIKLGGTSKLEGRD